MHTCEVIPSACAWDSFSNLFGRYFDMQPISLGLSPRHTDSSRRFAFSEVFAEFQEMCYGAGSAPGIFGIDLRQQSHDFPGSAQEPTRFYAPMECSLALDQISVIGPNAE
jgi:hypothetical protein